MEDAVLLLTIKQFRATVEAGGMFSVTLKARGPAFTVQAETQRGDAVLVNTRRKQPRIFIDPHKAILLLHDLGIQHTKIDAEAWEPEQTDALRPSQPDRAAQMKAAHEAAAYDKWFREGVQASIDDPRPPVPHEEAMALFQARIDELTRKAGAGGQGEG